MDSVAISVIIPCFNARNWICETLESIMAQDIPGLEIIVVDDGSTDGSADIIRKRFPLVRLAHSDNCGPSRARNIGTELSKGEFIQYLDADDLLSPGKIRIQREALERSRGDVAYCGWQKLVKTKDGNYVKREVVKRTLEDPEIDLFTDGWHPPHSYLFRRSIVEKIGKWNETLPVIQDARFALDCALQGAKFVHCPEVVAYYRVHSSGSVSSRDTIAFHRDIVTNALQVKNWWKEHGGITRKRKEALLKVLGYAARATFEKDHRTFDIVYPELEKLSPGYVPQYPIHLRLVSKLLGYPKAENLALWRRRLKGKLKRYIQEIGLCFKAGAGLKSKFLLARSTLQSHLANKFRRNLKNVTLAKRYQIRLPNRATPMWLRTYCGDIFLFHEIFLDQCYYIPKALLKREVKVIVDLGAHIGLATCYFSQFFPEAKFVCVEPDAKNIKLFKLNTAFLKDRIQVIEGVISDRSGSAILHYRNPTYNTKIDNTSRGGRSVRSYTMEEIMKMAGINEIDILKIDIEETETRLFKKIEAWLKRVKMIIIEFHGTYSTREFEKDVAGTGFSVVYPGSQHGNRLAIALKNELICI